MTKTVQNQGLLAGIRKRYMKSEAMQGYTLLSPTIILVLAVLAVPVTALIVISFWTQDGAFFNTAFTLEHYERFFTHKRDLYMRLLFRSIAISALVTFFTVLLAYPAAYFIAFRVKHNKMMWLILITAPFWTSYLLRVFSWKVVLGYNGVLNSSLLWLGVIEVPMDFILYNMNAVVLTLTHAWVAFAILPIYVSLEKIDRTLIEAAADLGENPVMQFLRVTLPLSLPGVIAASLLVFIPTVGDYITAKMVGGRAIMIGNLIQTQFGKGNNWPFGSAMAIVSMMMITGLVCAFLWASHNYRKKLS